MTEKKLTEAEIMKALECCIERRDLKQCNNYDCPLQYKTSTFYECKKMLVESALDLINRKNAENERLEALSKHHQTLINMLNEGIAEARAEAIKEFAERVKKWI